jgi:pimeloyl-ACP methyl ester carboxylesterase
VQIETRYARNHGATIAWTSIGDAPTDLLFIPGFISHVEHLWEQPGLAGFFERLIGFTRFLVMDRRGCGLSDPRNEELSLDDEVGDVLAVLDAAGSERAVLMGYTTGGLLAITTAARAPERVQAMVLYASMARAVADDDVDWTYDEAERRQLWARLAEVWGTGLNLEQLAPSRADDPRMRAWMARMERLSSSPGELVRLMDYVGSHNVGHLLGELRVPTLILHRTGDRLIDVRHSRYGTVVGAGLRFEERGMQALKGVPGRWPLFALAAG